MAWKRRTVCLETSLAAVLRVGQRLLAFDEPMSALLKEGHLAIEEVQSAADLCDALVVDHWGFVPSDTLLTYGDLEPNPRRFLAGTRLVSPFTLPVAPALASRLHLPQGAAMTIRAVINVFPKETALDEQYLVTALRESGHQSLGDEVRAIRARLGVCLIHEMAHAFGLNQQIRMASKPSNEALDHLADSVAYLSCVGLFGEEARFGVHYLVKDIDRSQPVVQWRTQLEGTARRMLASFRTNPP